MQIYRPLSIFLFLFRENSRVRKRTFPSISRNGRKLNEKEMLRYASQQDHQKMILKVIGLYKKTNTLLGGDQHADLSTSSHPFK